MRSPLLLCAVFVLTMTCTAAGQARPSVDAEFVTVALLADNGVAPSAARDSVSSGAPRAPVLIARSNLPHGYVSHLVNGPIGGLGHPSAKQSLIVMTVVLVAIFVILRLAVPGS